jgi:transcriptional regulator with XRE-family HTH domain
MIESRKSDPVMSKVRTLLDKSGLSLHELGVRMGYPEESARKSAWQFIQKTDDPRLSMLRRFAKAMSVPLSELLDEGKKRKS